MYVEMFMDILLVVDIIIFLYGAYINYTSMLFIRDKMPPVLRGYGVYGFSVDYYAFDAEMPYVVQKNYLKSHIIFTITMLIGLRECIYFNMEIGIYVFALMTFVEGVHTYKRFKRFSRH